MWPNFTEFSTNSIRERGYSSWLLRPFSVFSLQSEQHVETKLHHISRQFIRIKSIVLGYSSGFMCCSNWEATIIQFYLFQLLRRLPSNGNLMFRSSNITSSRVGCAVHNDERMVAFIDTWNFESKAEGRKNRYRFSAHKRIKHDDTTSAHNKVEKQNVRSLRTRESGVGIKEGWIDMTLIHRN